MPSLTNQSLNNLLIQDKEVVVEPIYTDVGQASVKTASTAVPASRFNLAEFNRMEPAAGNSRLTAHELVLGFQRHQTQRQQMNAQQTNKNHCSCDANSQNIIGNGAKVRIYLLNHESCLKQYIDSFIYGSHSFRDCKIHYNNKKINK